MKASSIRSYLKPYSIFNRRRTTVAHAFASAIARVDPDDLAAIQGAIVALAQDPDGALLCVYCDAQATGWDHLHGLVRKAKYDGYGHVIRNLVPCCSSCNSKKGGKEWRKWLEEQSPPDATARISRIEAYSVSLEEQRRTSEDLRQLAPELMQRYEGLQDQICELMKTADTVAKELREISAKSE